MGGWLIPSAAVERVVEDIPLFRRQCLIERLDGGLDLLQCVKAGAEELLSSVHAIEHGYFAVRF